MNGLQEAALEEHSVPPPLRQSTITDAGMIFLGLCSLRLVLSLRTYILARTVSLGGHAAIGRHREKMLSEKPHKGGLKIEIKQLDASLHDMTACPILG